MTLPRGSRKLTPSQVDNTPRYISGEVGTELLREAGRDQGDREDEETLGPGGTGWVSERPLFDEI